MLENLDSNLPNEIELTIVMTHLNSFPRGCYVILHIRPGPPYPDEITSPQIAAAARFQLSDDIWIEKLGTEFATHIQRACEPANYKIDNDVHDRHLYAFMREIPEIDAPRDVGVVSRDEAVSPLFTVIALSRLVRPTSTGDRYCAKIFPHFGADPPIKALQVRMVCPEVFINDSSGDWLSPDDGLELRRLMPWVSKEKKMHGRVQRAFWNHEQAMRTYYLDMRWNLVVSGLEALINVEKYRVSPRFKRRVGKLATEFGINLTEDELDTAYTLRSELTHAQSFLYGLHAVLPPDEHRPLYDKLESLLRAALKRCFLDEPFGQYFADDTAVKSKWD